MRTKLTLRGEEIGVFDDEEIDMNLAIEFETVTGLTIVELGREVSRGAARGIQAMVWLTHRQAGKQWDLHQNFKFNELEVDNLEDEAPVQAPGKGVTAVKAA